jgi:FlaA1/EpsC-like NDP-sugar epimerase
MKQKTTINLPQWLIKHRRLPIALLHLGLVALANYIAFWLRFDGAAPPWEFYEAIVGLIVIRCAVFLPFRLYEGLWRYTSIEDLRNILAGVVLSTVLFAVYVYAYLGITSYPRSILIIDTMVLILLMSGVRLAHRARLVMQHLKIQGAKRVLLYGAGDAGEMIVRDFRNNGGIYHTEPIGFIDDDPQKVGLRIHGVPVLGTGEQMHQILRLYRPDEVLLAIPSAAPALIRRILTALEPYKIPIKTLPTGARYSVTVGARQIQDLSVEDLLERLPVGMDLTPVQNLVKGKRILITGAGGSIGSELSRQIARYAPASLVLLDQSESALYDIEMELQRAHPGLERVAALADVKNERSVEQIFVDEAPEIVFHAAAYKHVPMMEHHPTEAVLNNIVGTQRLMQIAVKHKVQRFVLISTDKAVNPTNIMGATKRVNEMCIQALAKEAQRGDSIFAAVRFGNVLGSNGSVVPLFLKQIEQGGPITITHPEVVRYFMTIPEAVILVLQAATIARGGEIFVLDMGEQIKLMDMARHLIRMAGFIPDVDIVIRVTGLRPGEKLREELVAMDEALIPSGVEKIHRVQSGWIPDVKFLRQNIDRLENLATHGQGSAVIDLLFKLVPTFRPLNVNTESTGSPNGSHSKRNSTPKLRIADQSA